MNIRCCVANPSSCLGSTSDSFGAPPIPISRTGDGLDEGGEWISTFLDAIPLSSGSSFFEQSLPHCLSPLRHIVNGAAMHMKRPAPKLFSFFSGPMVCAAGIDIVTILARVPWRQTNLNSRMFCQAEIEVSELQV